MDKRYNHLEIEKKWQDEWEKEKTFKTEDNLDKKKFYCLDMFPYPSGVGLHVGHPRGYTATDIVSHFKRMNGFNVLHPMGWDAFGLPAENYALKTGINPRISTEENIQRFKSQIKSIGLSYDWSREVNTTDPEYYKWTQWIFIQLFEKGLAYESIMPINWCPSCKTGLANEEVVAGKCDRCGAKVERKDMRQWVLKITEYADRLLEDLEGLDWPDKIKEMQKNWIGRSEGADIEFSISGRPSSAKAMAGEEEKIKVYTTRPDTIFGATFLVLAPEHRLVDSLLSDVENIDEVKDYIEKTRQKSDLERTDLAKEKTGVELRGIKAVNPVNGDKIPVWIADYVLGFYGYGAIMSVPAHDTRDYEFAKKYNLPIKQVIAPNIEDYKETKKVLECLSNIYEATNKRGLRFWLLGGTALAFNAGFVYRRHSDLDLIIKDKKSEKEFPQLMEEIGFVKIKEKKLTENLTNIVYKNKDDIEVDIGPYIKEFGINDEDFEDQEKELEGVKSLVISRNFLKKFKELQFKERGLEKDKLDLLYLDGNAYTEGGVLVNSGEFDGMDSNESKRRITEWMEKKGIGKKTINYKLRDWVFSRQRYWGEPIPLIHCEKCGIIPVPENELPLELPEVKNYQPTGTGESPLVAVDEWVNAKCPKCGGPAKRETNTMPQWAGSCWYYLRYIDPKNDKALIDSEKEKCFMPVDLYVGGAEHAVLHLLYARFWHKFLYDIGVVSTKEPFKKLMNQGLIMASDGTKMSKSKGNVVNPDDIIKEYGADTLRLYEMFVGPFADNVSWDPTGINGVRRFLERVWDLKEKVVGDLPEDKNLEKCVHSTIKKVTNDIEEFKFNTSISALMVLSNEFKSREKIKQEYFEAFLKMVFPFAPHIAEELWNQLGNKKNIVEELWPKYDESLIKEERVTIIIQINGKVREEIEIEMNEEEDKIKEIVLKMENVKKWVDGKEIKKIIFVPNKLVNIVI